MKKYNILSENNQVIIQSTDSVLGFEVMCIRLRLRLDIMTFYDRIFSKYYEKLVFHAKFEFSNSPLKIAQLNS